MNVRNILFRPAPSTLGRYETKVVEDDSSGSYGEPLLSDDSEEYSSAPGRTESQEFTVELAPMFATHGMKVGLPGAASPIRLEISQEESALEQFNCPETPPPPPRVEPIERIVVNTAHLEQFPKTATRRQSIFAWADMQYSSEYQPVVQAYFKNGYMNILLRAVKLSFLFAPNVDKLNNLASERRQISAGRILYHYVGHGFPTITEESIWCSERRSTDFVPFPLEEVFWRLEPPTWFVFDCSNAGAVISAFKRASENEARVPSGCNRNDWLCICATDVGEELPQDPNLPHDFLTACLFSPVKMAIVCHILQHYRSTFLAPKFPLETDLYILSAANAGAYKNLAICLSAIEDAIAADMLEPELYHRIFRMDRLSAVLFRNFLLAQFLLRPYHVHPVSHPALPDVSLHPLWKEWSTLVDSVIMSQEIPKQLYAQNLFHKNLVTFKSTLTTNQLHKVRAYHLIFIFHMLAFKDATNEPIFLLAEYSSRPGCNPVLLTTAATFHRIFASMIERDGKSEDFHSLCYLVLKLLYHRPGFAMEIRKEIDVSKFPWLVFEESLPLTTRILISAIIASLLVSNDVFLQVCASNEYLVRLRKQLEVADTIQSLWLLLIVRRTFHMCPPDPALYVGTALHLECAQYINHPSPACRAAAVGSLASLLRPYECNINGQLMFMALPLVMDASYLVRFHLLLLLKRFMISFDARSQSVIPEPTTFPTDSYSSMMAGFFKCSTFSRENVYNLIDEVVHMPHFLNHAYTVALFLLNYYMCDPHPSVADLAGKLIVFVQNQRREAQGGKAFPSMNTNDDEVFHSLDQNESLYRIALRDLVTKRWWKPGAGDQYQETKEIHVDQLPHGLDLSPNPKFRFQEKRHMKFDGVEKIAFHQDSLGIAIATYSALVYIDDRQRVCSIPCKDVDDIQVVEWDNKIHVIASANGGSIFVWPTETNTMALAFRASADSVVFAVSPTKPYIIVTVDTTNTIYHWDMRQEIIVGEWESGGQTQATALAIHPTIPDFYVIGHKNGVLKEVVVSDPSRCSVNNVSAPKPNLAIKKVAISRRPVPEVFSVCDNGRCDFWKGDMCQMQPLKQQHLAPVFDFAMHPLYPLLVFSQGRTPPFVTDLDGKVLHTFKGVSSQTVCAFHPVLPIMALGNAAGDLIIYQFSEQTE